MNRPTLSDYVLPDAQPHGVEVFSSTANRYSKILTTLIIYCKVCSSWHYTHDNLITG